MICYCPTWSRRLHNLALERLVQLYEELPPGRSPTLQDYARIDRLDNLIVKLEQRARREENKEK